MKTMLLAAVAALAIAGTAQAAETFNTGLVDGTYYGSGNTNDHWTTNTVGGIEIGLRAHAYQQVPDVPAGDVYSVALGVPVSLDFSFDPWAGGSLADLTGFAYLITINNLGNGQSVSFNPSLIPDNAHNGVGTFQNSERFTFSFLGVPLGYNMNQNGSYGVSFTAGKPGGDAITTDIRINQGLGVPEPATWAMMIFGFGMIGATLRGRRSVTA